MAFLSGLDSDLKQSVLGQLRDLWAHNSTAIEGNALTLAETHFVLAEGLTVKGKPIKDHNEVVGHDRAVDLLFSIVGNPLTAEDVFQLHCAVQTEVVVDIMKPNGAWKREPNGTYAVSASGERVFIEFALPGDVPSLMETWIDTLNQVDLQQPIEGLVMEYAKLHIGFTATHPFWDGNGRLARLLSNKPLLDAGHPPLIVLNEHRQEYIAALNTYSLATKPPTEERGLWPAGSGSYEEFSCFAAEEYSGTQKIVEEAWTIQRSRAD